MRDYSLSQIEAEKQILKNRINSLVGDFYSKYGVNVSVCSSTKKEECISDTGDVESVSVKIETEVNCFL